MAQDRISGEPDTPEQGEGLTICYDFDGMDHGEVIHLSFDWTPESEPSEVIVSNEHNNNCKTITVPEGATSVVVSDTSGESNDWARVTGEEN